MTTELEKAVTDYPANLRDANLIGANLSGADLGDWKRGDDGFAARREDGVNTTIKTLRE